MKSPSILKELFKKINKPSSSGGSERLDNSWLFPELTCENYLEAVRKKSMTRPSFTPVRASRPIQHLFSAYPVMFGILLRQSLSRKSIVSSTAIIFFHNFEKDNVSFVMHEDFASTPSAFWRWSKSGFHFCALLWVGLEFLQYASEIFLKQAHTVL